jgi:hypothetical protein
VWGTGVWNTGVWGGGASRRATARCGRSPGTAFQLRFDETSSTTRTAAALLEGSYQPTVGAWAVYSCDLAGTQLARI